VRLKTRWPTFFVNSLIYLLHIENVVIFQRWFWGNMMQHGVASSQIRAYRKVLSDDEASHSSLSRYSRRLLVSGIARSSHHKSIRAVSRSCFEVVLWYTWMQHRKATWYDMTRIKVNRVTGNNTTVTVLSKRSPCDTQWMRIKELDAY